MLSLEAEDLCLEIARAEEFRRKHTTRLKLIVQRFVGNWYRTDMTDATKAVPENLVFSYVAWMLPNLAYSNPTCRVQASRPVTDRQIAEWMEWALREWLPVSGYVRTNRDTVRDMLFGWGVQVAGVQPRDFPGEAHHDAPGQLMPFVKRVPPEDFIMDPRAQTPEEARFLGHKYWRDLDELKADPVQWPPDKVAGLEGGADYPDPTLNNEKPFRPGDTPDRHRVCLVDLWIPESNTIATIAMKSDVADGGGELLRLESYWGPPSGPYKVYGAYTVPGDPWPLGVLPVVMEQLEELWAHQKQASDEAVNYKKVILCEASALDVQKAILEGTSGGVYTVNGLGNKVMEVDVGGAPEGRLRHVDMVRDRADRTLGMGDAQRGMANSKTATVNTIAQSNADVRTAFLKTKVQEATADVMHKVGWFLFYDAGVVMPVSSVDPMTGQPTEGTFLGGIQRGQEGIDWIDFRLTIDVQSMEHSDDQALQARAMELLNVGMQVCPMIVQFPWFNWYWVINNIGESFNQKDLASILINRQFMAQMGQMQQLFGSGQPGMLPAGVGQGPLAAGLGMPAGPGPQWQQGPGMLPPGAAGGMAAAGGGGGFGGGGLQPRPPSPMMKPGVGGGGTQRMGGARSVPPGPRTSPFMFIGQKMGGGPRAGAKAASAASATARPPRRNTPPGPRTPRPGGAKAAPA